VDIGKGKVVRGDQLSTGKQVKNHFRIDLPVVLEGEENQFNLSVDRKFGLL